MARAKRTARSEARRRYRAAMTDGAGPAAGNASDASPAVPSAAIPRDARQRLAPPRAATAPAPRPGIMQSLRASYRPVDVRGDIRALPSIALHSKAIWLPGAAILGTGALLIMVGGSGGTIVQLLASLVLQPPPMIVAFVAGIFAPRAAWLAGGLMSTLAAAVYAAVFFYAVSTQVTPLGWTYQVSDAQKWAYASQFLLSAPLFGIAVGAFAGFYRRFLASASPAQQQARNRRR